MRHFNCVVWSLGLLAASFTISQVWAVPLPTEDNSKTPSTTAARTETGNVVDQAVRLSDEAQISKAELLERQITKAVESKQFQHAVDLSLERLHLYPTENLENDYDYRALRKLIARHLELQRQAGENVDALAKAWQPIAVTKAELDGVDDQAELIDAAFRQVVPKLADQIVKSHPKHPVAAALVLIDLDFNYAPNGETPEAMQARLGQHRKQGLGDMGVTWAQLDIASALYSDAKASQKAFEQIAADVTTVEVKQYALIRTANQASQREDKNHLETVQQHYRKAISLNPKNGQANTARVRLIESYLPEDKPNVNLALKVVTQMRIKHRDVSFGDPLVTIARHLLWNQQPERGMNLMREIISLYPQSSGAAFAWLCVAEEHQRAGRTEEMIKAYGIVAAMKPLDTHRSIMDASNTRNIAHERLAYHHMKTGDLKEALKWWQRWEPSSWCGNCYAGMLDSKRRNILHCKMKVGLFAEAIEFLEPHIWAEKDRSGYLDSMVDNDTIWHFIEAHAKLDKMDILRKRNDAYFKKFKSNDEQRDIAERVLGLTALYKVHASGDIERLWQCVRKRVRSRLTPVSIDEASS